MSPKPDINYTGYNQQASAVPDTEMPRRDEFSLHANPEDFGAQVGGALQKLGATGEKVGTELTDTAIRQQTVLNESLAAGAEAKLIEKNANAKAQFLNLEGRQAASALPDYQKTLMDNYQSLRQDLPVGALRQFDMLGIRQNASYNSEAITHAVTQEKKANMMDHLSLINATQDQANNPNLTAGQVGELNGTATYAHGSMLDENHPGLEKDNDGSFMYADTPEGNALKHQMQTNIEYSKGIIWQNAITAKADKNPIEGMQFFQDNKDAIPPVTQARIESLLTPKVNNYKADGIVNTAMGIGLQQYSNFLVNPPSKTTAPIDFVLQHEGGFVSNDSGKGPTNFGINQEANPDIDVKNLTQDQARNLIKTRYADPIGADKMSPEMASVAVDSAVNMGVAKTKTLLAEANGDPQKLIDLRRQEYQRLATENPAKYAANLPGWNSRLDDLQKTIQQGGTKYATNPDGSRMTDADYFASHREDVLAHGAAMAERDFPGNPTYQNAVRERLTQQMDAAIKDQTARYKQDNQYVTKAIFGDLSKGAPPTSFQQLRALPGVGPVLDRVYSQDPKFAEGIDRMISQANRGNTVSNSPNAYQTILRSTEPEDGLHPNRIGEQNQLHALLGRTDGTGINMKDFNDASILTDAPPEWKSFVSDNMKTIANANGNVDGQGQTRALNWYNNVNQQYKAASGKEGFDAGSFIENLKESTQPHQASRMEQITNWAKNLFSGNQPQTVTVVSPNGQVGTIPSGNLEKALAAGYKRSQ